jgi:hypothetical protein
MNWQTPKQIFGDKKSMCVCEMSAVGPCPTKVCEF